MMLFNRLVRLLRNPVFWTVLAAAALFPLGVRNHALWGNHEPYVGGIVREMAASGNWVVPTLNGEPYLEKPPLFYALGALGCRAFGSFEPWVLRLPSALMAMATMLGAAFLGRRLGSARAGAWAGLLVGTNALFLELGHTAVVDMTLAASVSLSLGLALLAIREPRLRSRWVGWFWASLGLAFLAKGMVGPVLVLLPLLAALALWREEGLGTAFLKPNWGMAALAGGVCLWVVPLALAGGREFLVEVFLRNTVGRFSASPLLVPRTGRLGEHVEPFHYYLRNTPGYLLPWLPLWGAALAAALPGRRGPGGPGRGFLPLAFAVDLLLLSLSKGKRMVYLLPVLPVTFVHAALWLDGCLPPEGARAGLAASAALGACAALVGLAGAALPWAVGARSGPALALAAGSLAMTVLAAQALRRRLWSRGLGLVLAHWTVFVLLFMGLAAPALDRKWRPLQTPYRLARALEAEGCQVLACRLSEAQLGYASLAFGHALPCAGSPEAVARALASGRPVLLLMEARPFWRERIRPMGLPLVEVPTEASRAPIGADRAPALILNPQAARICGYPDC